MAKEAPVVNSVKMQDGRVVDFPGKRKLQKETFLGEDNSVTVRLDFSNGETRDFTIPKMLYAKFAGHGAEQKLGDEIAGLEDVDDCVIAVDELIGRLEVGEWGVKREGSGMSGTSILLRAIVEVTGKSVEKIKEYLKGKSQTDKMALREMPKYAGVVKRLEAEKKAKAPAVDTTALDAEIDAI